MGKTALSNWMLFVFICTNLGATVHAEEMKAPAKDIIGGSTTELEMTTDFGFGETKTPVSGWSGFGIAYGAYYYF